MKFIPILFSTPMVQAINDGRKTMTRRTIGVQPKDDGQKWRISTMIESTSKADKKREGKQHWVTMENEFSIKDYDRRFFSCPYGKPGDILWIRETWQYVDFAGDDNGYVYKSTDPDWETIEGWTWKPSIHMPKSACRIFLKVKSVWIERLQDITEQDAIAEGIEVSVHSRSGATIYKCYENESDFEYSPKDSFQSLWQSINGPGSWAANPWVWVIEFERYTPTSQELDIFYKIK